MGVVGQLLIDAVPQFVLGAFVGGGVDHADTEKSDQIGCWISEDGFHFEALLSVMI